MRAAKGKALLAITGEQVEEYLLVLEKSGRTPGTVQTYRRCLEHFLQRLRTCNSPGPGLLPAWQGELLAEGYSPRTVNTCLSVVGNFLAFLGRRDLPVPRPLALASNAPQPELTREEYLRLLQAAKAAEKERAYLLVKIFALIGLPVQEIEKVTVEAATLGRITAVSGGIQQFLRIPPSLQGELLDYARRKGIREGPLFCTRAGKPLSRSNVSGEIRVLGRSARVPEEKCNPRCLRKLFGETQASIAADLRRLAEQTYDQMLWEEQRSVGWRGETD